MFGVDPATTFQRSIPYFLLHSIWHPSWSYLSCWVSYDELELGQCWQIHNKAPVLKSNDTSGLIRYFNCILPVILQHFSKTLDAALEVVMISFPVVVLLLLLLLLPLMIVRPSCERFVCSQVTLLISLLEGQLNRMDPRNRFEIKAPHLAPH